MLLDPATLEPAPLAPQLLERAAGDARFKAELPAAQVEIAVAPAATVPEAAAALAAARRDLAALADGLGVLAGAGTTPLGDAVGAVTPADRYAWMVAEFGEVARRQLVFGLHVHVAVRPVERAIAVHDALRSYLPELAALAANAPFHAGRDTGLASFRPKISETLPRQGVPPALGDVDRWAQALAWGARAGRMLGDAQWWWELRPHPLHGTIELRVPDAQATVGETAAVAAVAHCLVVALADRHAAREALPVHDTWRIEENRWSACRHGVRGTLADLATGEPVPADARLRALLDELAPVAARLDCAAELAAARALVDAPAFERVRAEAGGAGARGAARWLASRFHA